MRPECESSLGCFLAAAGPSVPAFLKVWLCGSATTDREVFGPESWLSKGQLLLLLLLLLLQDLVSIESLSILIP